MLLEGAKRAVVKGIDDDDVDFPRLYFANKN